MAMGAKHGSPQPWTKPGHNGAHPASWSPLAKERGAESGRPPRTITVRV